MNKLLTFSVLLLLAPLHLYSQGDIDEQQRIFYRNERTVGLSLNSNGFGISYREGKDSIFQIKDLLISIWI
ncbi:MAG: hypothetical protein R2744_13705 [Bacteroidales bacterium]